MQAYVKIVMNSKTLSVTFPNGDDSGLTTNVFLQNPRVIALSVRRKF